MKFESPTFDENGTYKDKPAMNRIVFRSLTEYRLPVLPDRRDGVLCIPRAERTSLSLSVPPFILYFEGNSLGTT